MSIPSMLQRYMRASGINFITQLVYYTLYFVGIRTILSTLTKEENGHLALVQQWTSSILSVALLMGYNTYALKYLGDHSRRSMLFSTLVWTRLIAAGLVTPLLLLSLWSFARIDPLITLAGIAATLLAVQGNTLRTTFDQQYHAQLLFRVPSLLSILDIVLLVLLLWTWKSHLDTQTVFVAQIVSALPSMLFLIWRSRLVGILRFRIDKIELEQLRANASHISVVPLALMFHTVFDITILEQLSDRTNVGIFGATRYGAVPILILVSILNTPLIPALAEKQRQYAGRLPYHILRSFRLIMFIIGSVAIFLCCLATPILEFLSSGVYGAYTNEFMLQVWVGVGAAMQTMIMNYLLFQSSRAVIMSAIVLVAGSLLFDWWLVHFYQTQGLLIAKLCSITLSVWIGAAGLQRTGISNVLSTSMRIYLWLFVSAISVPVIVALTSPFIAIWIALLWCLAMASVCGVFQFEDMQYLRQALGYGRTSVS